MRKQPATLQRPQAEIGPQAAAPKGGLGISLWSLESAARTITRWH